MRLVGLSISLALTFGCAASQSSEPEVAAAVPGAESTDPDSSEVSLAERAEELAQKFLIVDGHIDLPYRLEAGEIRPALTEDNEPTKVTLILYERAKGARCTFHVDLCQPNIRPMAEPDRSRMTSLIWSKRLRPMHPRNSNGAKPARHVF